MKYLLIIMIMGRRHAEFARTKKQAKERLKVFGPAIEWTLYDDSLCICDSSGVHLDYHCTMIQ